jgi:hypothetical protein
MDDEGGMGGCEGSKLTGGFDMSEAIEGCVLAGERFDGAGFDSRPVLLLSDVYMTATFVDGEFIVPVSDHPIAVEKSVAASHVFYSVRTLA